MTFEEYIQEKHAEQYQGLDDGMSDDLMDWTADLEVEDWFKLGNGFLKHFNDTRIRSEVSK